VVQPVIPLPGLRIVALVAMTAGALVLCIWLAWPFLPALTWAIALAVLALPLHKRIERKISNANVAATLSTTLVVLLIAVPVAIVSAKLIGESQTVVEAVREQSSNGAWRERVARIPRIGPWLSRQDPAVIETRARESLGTLASSNLSVAQSATSVALQMLAAVFILFFFVRDRRYWAEQCRALMPLSTEDANRILKKGRDAINATVYGTFVTAVLQGVTGGLLFWALGLPAPVLWGVIMTVLGILPFVGAILVWAPAAAFLVANDRWGAAIALVVWGLGMAGPVCNSVYALTVGNRMRTHPVPTFLAYVGGLATFGVSGMILGPCILAGTIALLHVWSVNESDVDQSNHPSLHVDNSAP
jgi:predicted PurR-regulated permease PerM